MKQVRSKQLKKMISREEEDVMLDLTKGNLWLLLILHELQEKEHKYSSGKEIFRTPKNLRKICKDGSPRRLCHMEIAENEDRHNQ